MKPLWRVFLILVAGLAVAGALSLGWRGGTGSSDAPLRLGTNLWIGYEPLYLARTVGYLEGQGIDLVRHETTLEVIEDFRAGRLEAAAVTLDEALRLAETGPEMRIVLVMDVSDGGDVILGRPGMDGIADLKGKKVAVEDSAVGGYLLSRALEIADLRPDDIEAVRMPIGRHLEAFESGEVDAVVGFEPWTSRIAAAGGKRLFDSSRIPREIVDVLAVRKDVLETRLPVVERLLEAWFHALAYMKAKPEEAAIISAVGLDMDRDDYGRAVTGLAFPDLAANRDMCAGTSPDLLYSARGLTRFLLDTGLLHEPVDAGFLFDGRALTELKLSGI